MIELIVVVGFAVLAFQLNLLRMLLVAQFKQLRVLALMVEQLDGVDPDYAAEQVRLEMDRLTNRS